MYLNKAKLDGELHSYSIGLLSLQRFVKVVHSSFKPATTCSEQHLVEHRLSFSVEETTASGNWKHLLPLKIILVPICNGYQILEMAGT